MKGWLITLIIAVLLLMIAITSEVGKTYRHDADLKAARAQVSALKAKLDRTKMHGSELVTERDKWRLLAEGIDELAGAQTETLKQQNQLIKAYQRGCR